VVQPISSPTVELASSTPVPTATPVPAATPKPILQSPLTGLPVGPADAASRRPLVVKLGNSEAERPQAGLAQADVVYESVTEGGITRYAAIFQSREATTLGPIRSARLSDLDIAPEFSGVLAHVGASAPIMNMLKSGSVLDLDQFFWPAYYHRTADRVPPYNVYTSTAQLWTGAKDRGFSATADLAPNTFEDVAPGGPATASTIDLDFALETHSQYVYDAGQHAYHQVENSQPTADSATGQLVPMANVIVQFTPVRTTDIIEDGNGSHSLEYDMVGQGRAVLFHDGQELDGSWSRPALNARTDFLDASGQSIPLARGAVWIALVAEGTPLRVAPVIPGVS